MKKLPSYLGVASVIIYIIAFTLGTIYEVDFPLMLIIGLSPVLIPAAIVVGGIFLGPVYLVFTALWSAMLGRKF